MAQTELEAEDNGSESAEITSRLTRKIKECHQKHKVFQDQNAELSGDRDGRPTLPFLAS